MLVHGGVKGQLHYKVTLTVALKPPRSSSNIFDRKKRRRNTFVSHGSVPSSIPVRHDSEPTCQYQLHLCFSSCDKSNIRCEK